MRRNDVDRLHCLLCWFEIHNNTATDFELQGLVIRDDGTDSHTISSSLIILAGGFAVLGNNADFSSNGGVILDYQYAGFTLANSGDEVIIENGSTIIDRVDYDPSSFPSMLGAALSLDPNFLDATSNDDGNNWCSAVEPLPDGDNGSPGVLNPNC